MEGGVREAGERERERARKDREGEGEEGEEVMNQPGRKWLTNRRCSKWEQKGHICPGLDAAGWEVMD